jgi:radical SAM protein with 4Fe4S-binding SPASM domain
MDKFILVCPFNKELLLRLVKREIIISKSDFDDLVNIKILVNQGNFFHHFYIESDTFLSDIPFQDSWKDIPLLILVNGMGDFKFLMTKLQVIRKLKARFFFPSSNPESYLSAQILSSLGIDTGISFKNKTVHWERFSDLMHYAIYSKANHAYIQPFYYISQNYNLTDRINIENVFFNNPGSYLHLDKEGKIYLCREDIIADNPVNLALENIDKIKDTPEFQYRITQHQEHFINGTICAFCKAWRICFGRFSQYADQKNTCTALFSDLLEGIEFSEKIEQPA